MAVTGDGVNDGPALKAADIGVAVGAGSEVAKAAADLILMDNNFETLVAAIEEGRRIIANIRKVIVYLLSNAMHEIFLIGGSLLAGLALPINALQILFVNFFLGQLSCYLLRIRNRIRRTRANKARRTCNNRCGVKNPYPLHRFYWKCRTLTFILGINQIRLP